ncbi:hypothetical protein Aduo_016048 [Ancylostoma duodenale]
MSYNDHPRVENSSLMPPDCRRCFTAILKPDPDLKGYWKGSSLRVYQVQHKVRRAQEAQLAGHSGSAKEVVMVDEPGDEGTERAREAATTCKLQTPAAELPRAQRSSRLAALTPKRTAMPCDTAAPLSGHRKLAVQAGAIKGVVVVM